MSHSKLQILLKTAFLSIVFVLLAVPTWAQDETSTQLWLSGLLGHQEAEKLYLEVNIQPKVQTSGGDRWRSLNATLKAEYYPNPWFDLTGQLYTGYTDNINTANSFELTPKIGIRTHFIKNTIKKTQVREKLHIERLSAKRFGTAVWLRLEYRNLYYAGDRANSHKWRFRVRPELKMAINNPSLSDDKTFYARTDVEFFIPVGDDVSDKFVNKIRFRLGPAYRFNVVNKVELMFMYDMNRKSSQAEFSEDAIMLDLRVIHRF